jgi:hypothetical protein
VRKVRRPKGVKEVYIGHPVKSIPGVAGSTIYLQAPMSKIIKR